MSTASPRAGGIVRIAMSRVLGGLHMIRFRSLRVRMIVFLVALLGAVQVAEFGLTSHVSYNAARGKIEDELGVGQKVFARVLRQSAGGRRLALGFCVSRGRGYR